jgi:hypothetical protein
MPTRKLSLVGRGLDGLVIEGPFYHQFLRVGGSSMEQATVQ